jgi:hypothetical protein
MNRSTTIRKPQSLKAQQGKGKIQKTHKSHKSQEITDSASTAIPQQIRLCIELNRFRQITLFRHGA